MYYTPVFLVTGFILLALRLYKSRSVKIICNFRKKTVAMWTQKRESNRVMEKLHKEGLLHQKLLGRTNQGGLDGRGM
jgi:hypothetical protein